METVLSDKEREMLTDMMEMAQVKNLEGLYKFVENHCGETDLDYHEKALRDFLPKPNGKFREPFIIVVNEFTKYADEHGDAKKLPVILSKQRILTILAAHYQTSNRTAGHKLQQLIALGWVEPHMGNIKNPVITYHEALRGDKVHPGISR